MTYVADTSGYYDDLRRAPRGILSGYYDDVGYVPPRLVAPTLGAVSSKSSSSASKATRKQKFSQAAAKDAAKVRGIKLKMKSPKAKKDKSGRVSVPVTSFWSGWNAEASKVTKPFAGAIKASGLPSGLQKKLLERPLDAVLDIFDPIEVPVGRAIDRVIAKKGHIQNYFGFSKDVRRVQDIDKKTDTATQNLLKRLRTIEAFHVLFFTQPIDLAFEMAKEGLDIAGAAVQTASKAATAVGKAVGKAAQDIQKGIEEGSKVVASWFGLGYYDLGDAGVVSGPTAATAAAGTVTAETAAAGIGIEAMLSAALAAIASAITAALAGAAGTATKKIVEAAGQKATDVIASGQAPVEELPVEEPPVEEESAGIPPIAYLGAAALVALVLFKK